MSSLKISITGEMESQEFCYRKIDLCLVKNTNVTHHNREKSCRLYIHFYKGMKEYVIVWDLS